MSKSKRRWLPRKLSAYFGDRLRGPRALERQTEKEQRTEPTEDVRQTFEWTKETRAEILQRMRDDAEASGLAQKLDVTLDEVVALQDEERSAESKPLDPKHPNRAPWREVVAEAWGTPEERQPACETCTRGYAAIMRDFEDLGPKPADPVRMRVHYAELHGHPFDGSRVEPTAHCVECHQVGVRAAKTEKP